MKLTAEERFMQIYKSLTLKRKIHLYVVEEDKYYYIGHFYNDEGTILMEYNSKNEFLWCNYDLVWSIFEKEYGMNYDQIQALIKGLVEKDGKFRYVTPYQKIGLFCS